MCSIGPTAPLPVLFVVRVGTCVVSPVVPLATLLGAVVLTRLRLRLASRGHPVWVLVYVPVWPMLVSRLCVLPRLCRSPLRLASPVLLTLCSSVPSDLPDAPSPVPLVCRPLTSPYVPLVLNLLLLCLYGGPVLGLVRVLFRGVVVLALGGAPRLLDGLLVTAALPLFGSWVQEKLLEIPGRSGDHAREGERLGIPY